MHLEHFDPAAMQGALDNTETTPEELKMASYAFSQHRRFLDGDTRCALDKALLGSPLRTLNETSVTWVDSVFECLGPQGKSNLEHHELDNNAPDDSRELCGKRIAQLTEEQALPFATVHAPRRNWDRFKSGPLLDPEDLIRQVASHGSSLQEEVLGHGYAPVVAPDCDGTLWHGDIGDLFFERALTQRWLKPECTGPLNQLCDRYGIRVHKDVNDTARSMMESRMCGDFLTQAKSLGVDKNQAYREFYGTQALCMAGLQVGFIKARAYEIMNEVGGLKERIFPEVARLLNAFANAGMVVVPISASLNLLVEIGVTFLGIPGRRALGVTTPHCSGALAPELIEPMPYGQGKITLISQLGGLPPAVALGDSWQRTDKELLEGAGLGLVIVHGDPPTNLTPDLHCLATAIPGSD